jgi:hypothetical protein
MNTSSYEREAKGVCEYDEEARFRILKCIL